MTMWEERLLGASAEAINPTGLVADISIQES